MGTLENKLPLPFTLFLCEDQFNSGRYLISLNPVTDEWLVLKNLYTVHCRTKQAVILETMLSSFNNNQPLTDNYHEWINELKSFSGKVLTWTKEHSILHDHIMDYGYLTDHFNQWLPKNG